MRLALKAEREQNDTLRGQIEENEDLRRVFNLVKAQLDRANRTIGNLYAKAREMNESDFGGMVALPATATPKAEGLEVNMQHSRNVRKTD
jgi:hypothetical protein